MVLLTNRQSQVWQNPWSGFDEAETLGETLGREVVVVFFYFC